MLLPEINDLSARVSIADVGTSVTATPATVLSALKVQLVTDSPSAATVVMIATVNA
jgi:hypothetical protein